MIDPRALAQEIDRGYYEHIGSASAVLRQCADEIDALKKIIEELQGK